MSLEEPGYGEGVVVTLALFVFIGIMATGSTGDPSVFVTWLWMGIGLNVTYLLYRVVVVLEQIRDAL